MPSFSEFLFGSPDKLKKVPSGTKQQRQFHSDLLAKAMGLGQGGYNQAQDYYSSLLQPGNEAYQRFSEPYMNQFEEQILPMIAERFAGMGALSSSGFGQALGGAGAGLQSQLAQLFAQLQAGAAQQQTGQYNQLAQTGLNYEPFQYAQKQGSQGFLGPLLGNAFEGAANAAGAGAAKGIGSLFKRPQTQTQSPLTGMYDALFRSGAIV